MRRWNSPTVNFMHILMVGVNVWVGLLNPHKFAIIFNFLTAGLIVGVNISSGLRLRKLDAERERMIGTNALNLAAENLDRVAKLTGAKVSRDRRRATINIGRYHYRITPTSIARYGIGWPKYTCLLTWIDTPYAERIASVILLLKNNPKIFEHWRRQDGWYA